MVSYEIVLITQAVGSHVPWSQGILSLYLFSLYV